MVARWVEGGFSYPSRAGLERFRGFRSASDTHDAIQDIFRTAFEERARLAYSGLKPYEGYLFAITRSVVLRKLRHDQRALLSDDVSADTLTSTAPSPEENVASAERQLQVRAYLINLSEQQRRFVELRFVEQRPQEEVAALIGWSRKKVRLEEKAVREGLIRHMKRQRGTRDQEEVLHASAG
jgi:RNA polymerase sigma-70 factor (ECF subfamily)